MSRTLLTPTTTAAPRTPLAERLASIQPGRYHIISCYLQLRPEDRERQAYLKALRQFIRVLEASGTLTGLARGDRLAVDRDMARIVAFVKNPGDLPHARGLALFACEALGLFSAIPLPRVRRPRLLVDDTPWIRELVATEEGFGRVLVAVLDRAHARFFEVTTADAVECACLAPVARRGGKFHGDRGDAPGWGEHDYHNRLAEELHRHYARVTRELEELTRRLPVRGIVIGGPLEHTAALARFLPGSLAARLLGRIRLNPTAVSAAEVQAATFEAVTAHDRSVTEAMLSALKDALGTGWAVEGPRETLRALARGQVRQLFLRADLAGGGYRCATTGRLALAKSECRGEGEPVPIQDVADEAVEEALRQRIEVITLDGEFLTAIDGFAATLRFR